MSKLSITKYSNGSYFCNGYIFTSHFFERWRERIRNTPSEEKIIRQALGHIKNSKLIKYSDGRELRAHNGEVFVIERKTDVSVVITVRYSWTQHRVLRTDFFKQFNLDQENLA